MQSATYGHLGNSVSWISECLLRLGHRAPAFVSTRDNLPCSSLTLIDTLVCVPINGLGACLLHTEPQSKVRDYVACNVLMCEQPQECCNEGQKGYSQQRDGVSTPSPFLACFPVRAVNRIWPAQVLQSWHPCGSLASSCPLAPQRPA